MDENQKYKKNTLRHWFLASREFRNETVQVIHCQFYNRENFFDGTVGSTSIVKKITLNEEEKEYEIQTNNTLYHCSFDSIFFEQQDKSPYKLPDYERIRKEYYKPVDRTALGKNDMLLVVADYNEYFFESLIFKNKDGTEGEYCGYPHIGMFTDTYLISSDREFSECKDEEEYIDIRYYVRNCGFEFYSLSTGKRSLWIENRGDSTLTIYENESGLISLQSGERILYREQANV